MPTRRDLRITTLPLENFAEELRIRIASADDTTDGSIAKPVRLGEERGNAKGARRLGFEVRERKEQPHCLFDPFLRHFDNGGKAFSENRPVMLAKTNLSRFVSN